MILVCVDTLRKWSEILEELPDNIDSHPMNE